MNISQTFISSLLQKEDIEGLLNMGAPSDEYNIEAQTIYLSLSKLDPHEMTIQRVENTIKSEWMRSFDLSHEDVQLRSSSIRRVALLILNAENGSS